MKLTDMEAFIVILIAVVLLFCFVFLIGNAAESKGYRTGQLDAHNGHWKYHMTTQPSGEVVWAEGDAK